METVDSKKVIHNGNPPEQSPLSTIPTTIPKTPAQNDKETAFYSALVNAWINTKMEKDKGLLALATAGIGLLGSLLTTVGFDSSFKLFLCFLIFLCFLMTIISVVIVFDFNAEMIKLHLKNESVNERRLQVLDRLIFWSFICGVILFSFLGDRCLNLHL